MIFIDNKYTRWYYAIVQRAQHRASTKKQATNLLGYVERHHVIPECFYIARKRKGAKGWLPGDPASADNLVFLTAREHFICHLLLTKMCTVGKDKMIFAFWRLLASKKVMYMNSRWYQIIKEEQAIQIGTVNKGSVCSKETREKRSKSLKGKVKSKEWLEKISKSLTGKQFSESHKNALKGPKSEEHKAALRVAAKTRKPHSKESNMKRAETLKGRKRPTVECPQCGKICSVGTLRRWHYSNCLVSNN